MPKKPDKRNQKPRSSSGGGQFRLEFKNEAQSLAWAAFQQHDVLFLTGPAGTGKSFLACAFAIEQILSKEKKRIVLTRPIVESGENLGFLPGEFENKVEPYMMPMYDCITKLVGVEGAWRDRIDECLEVAPIAYMRGRSQPLDSKILTPNGYCLMGSIKEGDFVIGSDGTPIKVEKIYPQGELDVFRVTFTDGVSVECSSDHLWDTKSLYERRYKKKFSTKTTAEIAKSIKYGHAYNHQIPITRPVQFSTKKLAIDPYVIGSLLGDGCMHKDASITLTSVDNQIVEEVQKRLPESLNLIQAKDSLRSPQYRVVGENNKNDLKDELRYLDLLGTLSHNKFIPEIYKQGDVSQRLELLRGLLDTDGCCFEQKGKRKPRVQYYSTSEKLAKDVASVVHSLGGTASVRERKFNKEEKRELKGRPIVHNHSVWVVGIRMLENPFRLNRKADKFVPLAPLRAIVSIEKVSRKECQCIRVDSCDNLYLTEHCIVTHNTFDDAVCIFDEAQNASMMQLKLFLTRFGENSKVIINGDPRQSDLGGDVALMEVVKKLKGVNRIGVLEFKENSIVRHPLVGEIINRLEE